MRHGVCRVGAALCALAVTGLLLGASAVGAQPQVHPGADRVVHAMSSYLGRLGAFTVRYEVDDEVIDEGGQKLPLRTSGDIEMQRPGRLHVTRRGGPLEQELFYDGRTVTLLSRSQNVYTQLSRRHSIDDVLEALRSELDLELPGADLFVTSPAEKLLDGVSSGVHLGTAVVNGVECDHLAFRSDAVDRELWVQRGDRPLPLQYRVVRKGVAGAPRYTLRLHDWNITPQLDLRAFGFTAPDGARRLDAATTDARGVLREEGSP
jgi:hypothetical protein